MIPVVKINLDLFETEPLHHDEFEKAVDAIGLLVFSDEAVTKFANDINSLIEKGRASSLTTDEVHSIEKGKRDMGKLVKKVVTDRNGKKTTKWVKRGEAGDSGKAAAKDNGGSPKGGKPDAEGSAKKHPTEHAKDTDTNKLEAYIKTGSDPELVKIAKQELKSRGDETYEQKQKRQEDEYNDRQNNDVADYKKRQEEGTAPAEGGVPDLAYKRSGKTFVDPTKGKKDTNEDRSKKPRRRSKEEKEADANKEILARGGVIVPSHLEGDDKKDYKLFADTYNSRKKDVAKVIADGFDTYLREHIPLGVWKDMGGELTESGKKRLEASESNNKLTKEQHAKMADSHMALYKKSGRKSNYDKYEEHKKLAGDAFFETGKDSQNNKK